MAVRFLGHGQIDLDHQQRTSITTRLTDQATWQWGKMRLAVGTLGQSKNHKRAVAKRSQMGSILKFRPPHGRTDYPPSRSRPQRSSATSFQNRFRCWSQTRQRLSRLKQPSHHRRQPRARGQPGPPLLLLMPPESVPPILRRQHRRVVPLLQPSLARVVGSKPRS